MPGVLQTQGRAHRFRPPSTAPRDAPGPFTGLAQSRPPSTSLLGEGSVPRGRSRPHQPSCHRGPAARFASTGPLEFPGLGDEPGLTRKQGREFGPPRARARRTAVSRTAAPPARPPQAKQATAPTATRQRFRGTHPGGEAGLATVPSRRRSCLGSASLSGATLDCPQAGARVTSGGGSAREGGSGGGSRMNRDSGPLVGGPQDRWTSSWLLPPQALTEVARPSLRLRSILH